MPNSRVFRPKLRRGGAFPKSLGERRRPDTLAHNDWSDLVLATAGLQTVYRPLRDAAGRHNFPKRHLPIKATRALHLGMRSSRWGDRGCRSTCFLHMPKRPHGSRPYEEAKLNKRTNHVPDRDHCLSCRRLERQSRAIHQARVTPTPPAIELGQSSDISTCNREFFRLGVLHV